MAKYEKYDYMTLYDLHLTDKTFRAIERCTKIQTVRDIVEAVESNEIRKLFKTQSVIWELIYKVKELTEPKKVYLVYEEYNPYIDIPGVSHRAEITIHGVYANLITAHAERNMLARKEAKEYDALDQIDKKAWKDPKAILSILDSKYYIYEFEVK